MYKFYIQVFFNIHLYACSIYMYTTIWSAMNEIYKISIISHIAKKHRKTETVILFFWCLSEYVETSVCPL